MNRRIGFVIATALLALGSVAWWQWGPAIFVAGMGSLIC